MDAHPRPRDSQVTPISAAQTALEIAVDDSRGWHLTREIAGVRWRVERWGFDTVEFRFDLRGGSLGRRPLHERSWYHPLTGEPIKPRRAPRSEGGGWLYAIDETTRIVASEGAPTVKVVTRPHVLVTGDLSPSGLLALEDMPEAVLEAKELVANTLGYGFLGLMPEPDFPRVDFTVDFVAHEHGRGVHLPAAAAKILRDLERLKVGLWDSNLQPNKKRPTAVEWTTEKSNRIQFVAYDKGAQQGAGPGTWLRLERRHRPTNPTQRLTPSQLANGDLRSRFLGPHFPHLLSTGGLVVCGEQAAADRLERLLAEGVISAALRRSLAGRLFDLTHGRLSDAEAHKARTKLARSGGITLDRNLPTDHAVDLGALLLAGASQWPRGAHPASDRPRVTRGVPRVAEQESRCSPRSGSGSVAGIAGPTSLELGTVLNFPQPRHHAS